MKYMYINVRCGYMSPPSIMMPRNWSNHTNKNVTSSR